MVLGKLPVPGRPTIWITEGQGPTAFAVEKSSSVFYFTLSHNLANPLGGGGGGAL